MAPKTDSLTFEPRASPCVHLPTHGPTCPASCLVSRSGVGGYAYTAYYLSVTWSTLPKTNVVFPQAEKQSTTWGRKLSWVPSLLGMPLYPWASNCTSLEPGSFSWFVWGGRLGNSLVIVMGTKHPSHLYHAVREVLLPFQCLFQVSQQTQGIGVACPSLAATTK